MDYAEHAERLAGMGFDTDYAGSGINPLKDQRETDPTEAEGWGEEEDDHTEANKP